MRHCIHLLALGFSIQNHQKACDTEPEHQEIEVKLSYLFKRDPSASAHRLTIVLVVYLGVPVLFVIPFSINMVVLINFAFGVVARSVVVVFCSVLFIEISKSLFAIKG